MARKYDAIDLMKLHSLGSANGWNEMLNECLVKQDINRLAKIRYQIAAGMDDLAKANLNSENMCVWFIRLQRSLENTAKKIIRQRNPLPHDNPLTAALADTKFLDAKKKRNHELELFFKRSNY